MSEFWLTPDGAIYCDGDAGVDVPNHEAVVRQRCLCEALGAMEQSDNEAVQAISHKLSLLAEDDIIDGPMVSETLNNFIDDLNRDGVLSNEEVDDIYSFIREHVDVEEWILDVAFGTDSYDVRAYAIDRWGWHRVVDRIIQTNSVTPSSLKDIADGLYDAYGEDCMRMKYTLEAGRLFVTDVPYMALESGDVSYIKRQPVA